MQRQIVEYVLRYVSFRIRHEGREGFDIKHTPQATGGYAEKWSTHTSKYKHLKF